MKYLAANYNGKFHASPIVMDSAQVTFGSKLQRHLLRIKGCLAYSQINTELVKKKGKGPKSDYRVRKYKQIVSFHYI
jgi:hypothetical protein